MAFGGFYKGEKKKQKKGGKDKKTASFDAQVFQMPEIISKKKSE